jgi:hypothetical protein
VPQEGSAICASFIDRTSEIEIRDVNKGNSNRFMNDQAPVKREREDNE